MSAKHATGGNSVTKLSSITPKTYVYVQRLREPGETTLVPTAKVPKERVLTTAEGVRVDHEDGKGYTLLPWHRILGLDYRKEDGE